jgi:hypothetical protein
MTAAPESVRPILPFYIYDNGDRFIQDLAPHVEAGRLPYDVLFRLASIGYNQPDLLDDSRKSLRWVLLHDILENSDDPGAMRPDASALIGGNAPDAVVDWYQSENHKFYARLDPMYYRMGNLVRVIRRQREEAGKTITEVPEDWYHTPAQYERNRCKGLAQPIWRNIVQRLHPEWLTRSHEFHLPLIGYTHIYSLGKRTEENQVLGRAVISDTAVYDFYQEAVKTGVVGIGPAGRESLRELLSDEHPELL